jgi:DNA sulfur modification protein DndB
VALRAIVQGEVTGKYSASVTDDEVSVVFIQFESLEKTRRIFNKVNRYARSTSRSDNLVLSEDDGAAYVARRLFMDEGSVLSGETSRGETLVNWKNSTLSGRSQQFTTLSALYETVKYACKSEGLLLDEKSNSGVRPTDAALEKGLSIAQKWWELAVAEIDSYKFALKHPSQIPQLREPAAKQSLLMKPAGQIVLFRSAAKVISMAPEAISISEFFKRANRVDWCMESPMWDNIFVLVQSKIMTKEENQSRSANLIAYLVAHKELSSFPDFMAQINSLWAETHPDSPLPKPLN